MKNDVLHHTLQPRVQLLLRDLYILELWIRWRTINSFRGKVNIPEHTHTHKHVRCDKNGHLPQPKFGTINFCLKDVQVCRGIFCCRRCILLDCDRNDNIYITHYKRNRVRLLFVLPPRTGWCGLSEPNIIRQNELIVVRIYLRRKIRKYVHFSEALSNK